MISKEDLPKTEFTIDDAVAALNCERKEVVDLCNRLDALGEGTFTIGRRGWPSRFKWKLHIPMQGTPIAASSIPVPSTFVSTQAPDEPAIEQSPAPSPKPYLPMISTPIVKEKRNEVDFFEVSSPGRVRLGEACKKLGLSWGIVKFSTSNKTKAMVLIGKLRETDEQEDLDACLSSLADTLEQEQKDAETTTSEVNNEDANG